MAPPDKDDLSPDDELPSDASLTEQKTPPAGVWYKTSIEPPLAGPLPLPEFPKPVQTEEIPPMPRDTVPSRPICHRFGVILGLIQPYAVNKDLACLLTRRQHRHHQGRRYRWRCQKRENLMTPPHPSHQQAQQQATSDIGPQSRSG